MALTYEEAKKIAQNRNPGVNRASGFGNAFAFYVYHKEKMIGGGYDVVVMKDTGETMNVTSYLMDGYCEGEFNPRRIPFGKKKKDE